MTRIVVLNLLLAFLAGAASAAEPLTVAFEVSETAGIRRRSDVITARLDLRELPGANGDFQLLRRGEPHAAQFRRVELERDRPELVIHFVDNFAPLESRRYVVRSEEGISSTEPRPGLTLKETEAAYEINSAGRLDWTVPRDLEGFFGFASRLGDFVEPGSDGLFFVGADGQRELLSSREPSAARIERQGPIASALQFEYEDWPSGAASTVEMEFVRTKSWVRVVWTVEGEEANVKELGAELQLRLEDPETLIDFGAGDFVYTTARQGHRAVLEAGPALEGHTPWRVLNGPEGSLEPIAVASRRFKTPRVTGWAHAMDQQRCTAVALSEFARTTRDRIEIAGDGELMVAREFTDEAESDSGVRRLEFWLHFVGMPVHIGARTSPRSMQEPLEVNWLAQ